MKNTLLAIVACAAVLLGAVTIAGAAVNAPPAEDPALGVDDDDKKIRITSKITVGTGQARRNPMFMDLFSRLRDTEGKSPTAAAALKTVSLNRFWTHVTKKGHDTASPSA